MNNGQKRLKKAFEKTSNTITPTTTSIMEQDDISMIEDDDDDDVVNDANKSNDQQQQHLAVVNEVIFNTIMQKNVRNQQIGGTINRTLSP